MGIGGIQLFKEWEGFVAGDWQNEINVRDFIQKNYTVYEGDDKFLAGPTENTKKVWEISSKLIVKEIKEGILGVDTDKVSGINNFEAGYIDKDHESIVGLQTDAPLKRMMNPYGGYRMVEQSLEAYGYEPNPEIDERTSLHSGRLTTRAYSMRTAMRQRQRDPQDF